MPPNLSPLQQAKVTRRGAERWSRGHPWIYASDVTDSPAAAGLAVVTDPRGKVIGQALCSPRSEIRLRLLEPSMRPIDLAWWTERIAAAARRREGIDATAYRVVHSEGDGLSSLIVDRYDRWLVIQLLSAGLETLRENILDALEAAFRPAGILLRHDVGVRRQEGLAEGVALARGEVPEEIEVREGPVRYFAAPWSGQKTGAFLDQREARVRIAALAKPGGEALDCFAYHGAFALHLARVAGHVVALDESKAALERGARNAELNGLQNISWEQADAFDALRAMERARRRFDTVVVDPPAFAKSKTALPKALRGYHEINLRAMKLVAPGGTMLSASCSFHLRRPAFLEMIYGAAGDSGRMLQMLEQLGQASDHPEIATIPETGYLKGAVLRAVDWR